MVEQRDLGVYDTAFGITDGQVAFQWKDYRQQSKPKVMRLDAADLAVMHTGTVRALTTAVVGIVLMVAANAIPAFLMRRRLRRGY